MRLRLECDALKVGDYAVEESVRTYDVTDDHTKLMIKRAAYAAYMTGYERAEKDMKGEADIELDYTERKNQED